MRVDVKSYRDGFDYLLEKKRRRHDYIVDGCLLTLLILIIFIIGKLV